MLERASEQAIRAGGIIQRLRSFMSRGETEKRLEAVPPLLSEAVDLVLMGIRQKGVGIGVRPDLPDVKILADKVQIQQVLLNLLRNAVEAVAEQEDQRVSLAAEARDDSVQISISDNGPGIPEEVRAKLFQPFVSTKRSGMGVGLSICHTIISAHDGAILAEPNPSGGTTFRITLPVVCDDGSAIAVNPGWRGRVCTSTMPTRAQKYRLIWINEPTAIEGYYVSTVDKAASDVDG